MEIRAQNGVGRGGKLQILYLLGPNAQEVEGDAIEAGAGLCARHAVSFDRVAVQGEVAGG
jgi:hypothetical protein